ncbi:DNA replication/repair protein RecF [Selenomonas sp.]|uniref:DNA replication/repair protein RecF n=1 Tax=Selenomonas sp. TaxID=2053611 RepID=UPI003FA312EF
MKAKSLQLKNFRNYSELELSLSPNINVLLGENAQGKTNIAEALYYAAMGRSHRTTTDSDLIAWDASEARLHLLFERLDVDNTLEFQFQRGKRRIMRKNGEIIKTKELFGTFNAVLFSPEDLFLIKGAPSERRRFLDSELSQASPAYGHELMQYARILMQRNNLLKKIKERRAKKDMLLLWDGQLAESAARIVEKRFLAVKKLNMLANLMQRRISAGKENLSLSYELYGCAEEPPCVTSGLIPWYNKKLEESRELDILRGSTSVGPQRDDILLKVNGINLRSFGSQGQQRTGVLALKLSELEFLRSETGEYPILLLDDVMSELDRTRRERLMEFISKERIQTLITATDEAYLPMKITGNIFYIVSGKVSKKKGMT